MKRSIHVRFSLEIPIQQKLVFTEHICPSRPDIAYAVHIVSQFVSAPHSTHWAALLRILRYVRCTIYQCLLLSSTSSLTLRAYADADWAADISDR